MAARRVGALFYVGSGTPMTTTLRRKDAATWGGTNADYTDLLETGALRSVKFLF